MINFEPFFEAVGQQMQPVGRVQHLIGMLQQLFIYTPDDATMADLVTGWQVLALPKSQNEEASLAHRRKICADLSIIAAQFTNEPGNVANAAKTWQACRMLSKEAMILVRQLWRRFWLANSWNCNPFRKDQFGYTGLNFRANC